jgi:ribosome maturation protein SDO1
VGNQTIYYRGHRILQAFQAHLLATALAGAEEVVVAGCSAGGLSTYLHADEWRAALPPSTRVTALSDSGFFPAFNSTPGGGYGALMRQIALQMNATLAPNCLAANAADPHACIFAEVAAAALVTPTFALQGKYDSWQLKGDASIPANDSAAVNAWGALVSHRLRATLLAAPQHGAFLDSCLHHCGGFDAFLVDGYTQATAHAAWYVAAGAGRALYNQSEAYPCAACCTGA